ncbi:unnamed protein product [Ectocarpus sp. 12 AP-2014]
MRNGALLAVAGAAVLVSAFCSSGAIRCDALILRGGVKRRDSTITRVRGGVSDLRAAWIDEQVSLEVPASTQDAYSLYSDLQRQPEWSPWLKSVQHDRVTGTSKWVIQSNGIKVSWNAQNTVEVYGSEVAWESTTGLSNRGRVTFDDKGDGRCLMTLTLSYNLPYVIASVLRLEAVERFVKRTILSDLARFKKVLVRQLEAAPASPSTAPKESVHGTPRAGATAAAAASTVAASATSSAAPAAAPPAPTPPAVAPPTTTPASSAAVITTTATADVAAGAPSVAAGADGVESEGEGKDSSRAPGRRSRWRRRFRRLLRRDRGQQASAPSAVAAVAEHDGS